MRGRYRAVTLGLEDRHWWYRGRRRAIRAVLDSLPLNEPVRSLDAGCGGGSNLPELARLGPVTGLEPSTDALDAARKRGVGTIVRGKLEAMPFVDGEFDLATAFDVVEHLEDDRAGFRELRRVVRSGGFLLTTVPAYPRLWGPHDLANEHRRRYLRRTLVAAAEPAGWRPKLVTHFNMLLLPAAALRRLQQRNRSIDESDVHDFELTSPALDAALEWPLRLEARVLAAGRTLPVGLSILALFEAVGDGGGEA